MIAFFSPFVCLHSPVQTIKCSFAWVSGQFPTFPLSHPSIWSKSHPGTGKIPPFPSPSVIRQNPTLPSTSVVRQNPCPQDLVPATSKLAQFSSMWLCVFYCLVKVILCMPSGNFKTPPPNFASNNMFLNTSNYLIDQLWTSTKFVRSIRRMRNLAEKYVDRTPQADG